MKRLSALVTSAVLAALAFSIISAAGTRGGSADDGKAPAAAFKPVAPLDVVMENVDDIFSAMEKKFSGKGLKSLKKDALFLAELSNVASFHKSEKDWHDWTEQNIRGFQKLAAESEKGDAAALKATWESINKVCEACHEKYRDK